MGVYQVWIPVGKGMDHDDKRFGGYYVSAKLNPYAGSLSVDAGLDAAGRAVEGIWRRGEEKRKAGTLVL